jgi:hypothetical protein
MSAQSPTITQTQVRRYYEDGLFELALGAAFTLLLGLMLVPEVPFFLYWYIPWMIVVLVMPQAKRKFSTPRGGIADIPSPGKAKPKIKLVLLGLLTLVAGLVAFTLTLRGDPRIAWLGRWIGWGIERGPLIAGSLLALMFAALAYRGRIVRFSFYAALAVITGAVTTLTIQSLRQGTGLVFGVVGVVTLVSGVILYVRFRRNNPVIQEPDRS